MNFTIFLYSILGFWVGVDALCFVGWVFGVLLISKRYPIWWETHICDRDPYQFQPVYTLGSTKQ